MKRVAVKQAVSILLTLCMLLSLALPIAAEGWAPSVDNADTGDDTCLYVVTDKLDDGDMELLYELRRVVHLLSMEMEAKLGRTFFVEYGALEDGGSTDILVCMDASSEIPFGGYALTANEDQMVLTASETNGILYGGRALLASLLANSAVDADTAAPAVAERAVTLDISKGNYTLQDLKVLVRELSFVGLNTLILQISDGENVGIESLKNVSVNAADGSYLTRDEVDALVAYADSYHVSVLPAFCAFGSNGYAADTAFVKTLVAEYGAYFAALGCDAFLLTGSRKDVALANALYASLNQQGYGSVRVESNQLASGLNAAVDVCLPYGADASAADGRDLFGTVVIEDASALYQSFTPLALHNVKGSTLILSDGTVDVTLLRAYAAKLWNTEAHTAEEFETFAWTQSLVGAAPAVSVEDLPASLDTTELEALIAEYPAMAKKENEYIPTSFKNYKDSIAEAKTYYRGAHLLHFNQNHVDAMCSMIRGAKDSLVSMAITEPLVNLLMEYSLYYSEEHFWEPYSLETWVPYTTIVHSAEQILNSGVYEPITIVRLCMMIEIFRDDLVRESTVAHQRVSGFLGGNFQTSYVYQGKKARMVLNTQRALNINVTTVSIFEQNGEVISLDATVTEAAYNRRKSNLRTYYVDMIMDLAPGTYTYRVYGTVDYVEENGNLSFRYTADYVDCTITVR